MVRSRCAVFLCTSSGKLQEQLFNRKRQAAESCQNRCAIRRRTKLFECLPYLQKLHKRAVRDDRSGPSTVPIPGEKTGPFHSPASLILARLIRFAQPRNDDSDPFSSSVKMSRGRSSCLSSQCEDFIATHGNKPRVFLALRTRSTPMAMAAVR